MDIALKKASEEGRKDCIRVEESAMKSHCYLDDVWDYFKTTSGDLTCAYIDGKMVGIGKFTLLYDGSAWLETLRVDPDFQGRGVGKEIYKDYFAQAEKYGCKSMAMYTGINNVVSAGLASRYGLSKVQEFRGYNLTDFTISGLEKNFVNVGPRRAQELIEPLSKDYHGYMVSNRTFYRINPRTIEGFSLDDKVFEDIEGNSFIVCGSRFQPQLSLHISMMGGDYKSALEFAKSHAHSKGINKLTFTIPLDNPKVEEFIIAEGFQREPSDLITMEINL